MASVFAVVAAASADSVFELAADDPNVVEAAAWAVDELRASSPAFASLALASVRGAAFQVCSGIPGTA